MKTHRSAIRSQTFVFFLVAFATVWLLCGLGLDAGLLYISKARLSRSCDAAVISGVKNFSKGRDQVAVTMRNIAIANYTDLGNVPTTATVTTNAVGGGANDYIYLYSNSLGNNITCTIGTGAAGQITKANCNAYVKQKTYFMAYTGLANLTTFKIHASAEAQRRPRLIMMVLDRSGSMLGNSGYSALPPAVSNFVKLFDTNADYIGMVSFSSFARQEMPITNNFIVLGTNQMYKADLATQVTTNPGGMKFGGVTASDEGMRLALEQMQANAGYSDPRTLKYIVFFTDGEFNSARSLYASPCWTNTVYVPSSVTSANCRSNTLLVPTMYTNSAVARANLTGAPTNFVRQATNLVLNSATLYSTNLNVWLQPGAINFTFRNGFPLAPEIRISRSTNMEVNIALKPGESNMLVVPGYIVDGVCSGYLAIAGNGQPSDTPPFTDTNGRWPDNVATPANSILRGYMLRNLTNILSDFLIFKPEDPDLNGDGKPDYVAGSNYYPGGAFFWPLDFYTLEYASKYINSVTRYSTNMAITPWMATGKLFYNTNSQMTSPAAWKTGAPNWVTGEFNATMVDDTTNNMWRPSSYAGVALAGLSPAPPSLLGVPTATGGAMLIGSATNVNCMAWNGRPTHYYDFSTGNWQAVTTWTDQTVQMLPMGNWKTKRYADAARNDGVTIYTIGFSASVTAAQQAVLKAMANDPAAGTGVFQPTDPIGKSYYTTTPSDITTYFQDIANKINAVITQ